MEPNLIIYRQTVVDTQSGKVEYIHHYGILQGFVSTFKNKVGIERHKHLKTWLIYINTT